MNTALVDQVIQSVLYEGCLLYPYRQSSIKNQQRWNFGIVYPEPMKPSIMATECIVAADERPIVHAEVRFLQIVSDGEDPVERRVRVIPSWMPFQFDELQGEIHSTLTPLAPEIWKVRIEICNRTSHLPLPDTRRANVLRHCLVSTNTVLSVEGGRFISMVDPEEAYADAVGQCTQTGTWPVLMGNAGQRDCMLSSPIILYDYPRIAPESHGDMFDGTEIDEILLLRILTLTNGEKEEIRKGDARGRRILELAESLSPEDMLKLHGTRRDLPESLKAGDRVRLHPKPGGDVFDTALNGRVAIIESVEQDYDERIHLAVVVEDDPGLDLGLMRQPGHRFFFSTEEVEKIA